MEKFSNTTFFRQIALQNTQRKKLGFSETVLWSKFVPGMSNHTKINPIVAHWGVENEIIVFLINEGSNKNVAMATKYFIF